MTDTCELRAADRTHCQLVPQRPLLQRELSHPRIPELIGDVYGAASHNGWPGERIGAGAAVREAGG